MAGKKFKIITLGCKVNQYESAYLKERLVGEGWCQVEKGHDADVSIVNTCIVTQRASYQSRQAVRRAIRENPDGITAAVGCYAQVFPQELSGIEGIGLIAGNREKPRLPDILKGELGFRRPRIVSDRFGEGASFDFLPIKEFPDRTRAFLKIQDGCESFCSYCIVPFARGPLRSLAPARVLEALESLCNSDYKEVVLTGVHLGKYGFDLEGGISLKGLLDRIGEKGLPLRIRLSSLEPNEIGPELIEMVASGEWICRHFHIPLQSGDDMVLKRMNRHYESRQFAGLVDRIHTKIPLAAIGVDVMTGFPGENEAAHRNTLALIDDLPVSYLHVFPFSPRKGTAASKFPGRVNPKVIKERAEELRELGKRKREAFYLSCLGREFSVLVEGWYSQGDKMVKGLSDNYLKVIFPSAELVKNSMSLVIMEGVRKDGVLGKPGSRCPGFL